MDRIIFHIDVNNAFLSWTAVKLLNNGYKYDIRDSYAVIGGDPKMRKGIVLAKSNLCKKLGIYTSETLYQAHKKCPNLKVYPPDYKYYSYMSDSLFKLLGKYTPDIEIASIDECYLDYGKVKKIYGDEVEFAKKIKKEIYETLGFTVNIGISNNKLCAKMASDFSKPNKIHTLYNFEIEEKMYPLPIGDLFGIGKKTAPKLESIGIKTIGDLANCDVEYLYKYFKNQSINMINLAKGIDDSPVDSKEAIPLCISNEITLTKDITNKEQLYPYLMSLCETVSIRLRNQKKYATVICVILKDNYFKRKSHQKKILNATNVTNEIYKYAKEILDEMYEEQSVRLIGVRLDKLIDKINYQPSIFESYEKSDNVDDVLDFLKQKYGSKIITKASLKDDNIINKLDFKK
jgi:DNA polymerase-4